MPITGLLLIAAIFPRTSRADEGFRIGAVLPRTISETWERKRDACNTAHWKVRGRELITRGLLNESQQDLDQFGPRPKEDEWRELERDIWIDFAGRRIRSEKTGVVHECRDDGTTPLVPNREIRLFDSVSLQCATDGQDLREHDPKGTAQGLVFEASMVPCFWAIGVVFGPDTPVRADKLNEKLQPEKFRIYAVDQGDNGSIVTVRATLDSKPGSFIELKIDSGKTCAIISESLTTNNQLYSQRTVDWELSDSEWRPVSWKQNSYRLDGTLAIGGEFEVVEQEYGADLSKIQFHIVPRPGTKYWDQKSDTTFVKSPGGQPDVPKDLYDIQRSRANRYYYWMASVVLCAVFIGGFMWLSRRVARD